MTPMQSGSIERACYESRVKWLLHRASIGVTWQAIGARHWPDLDPEWAALKASCAASRHAARGGRRWPLRGSWSFNLEAV